MKWGNSRPVVAIVQARMGASRLPNKMMLWLSGMPVAGLVLHRLRQAKKIDYIVFALPDNPRDDVLAMYLESQGASVFRGSENDVLSRFYAVATEQNAGSVLRVCADNPLVSGSEIDRIIDLFEQEKPDYAFNHIPKENGYPDGLGAEIVSYSILETLHSEARLPRHREHIFTYLWEHSGRFRIMTCNPSEKELQHPEIRLDLDTMDDYRWLSRLNVSPDSSAKEIVQAALSMPKGEV